MLYRPARAYDWAWDRFTPAERAKIQATMRERVLEAWNSGEIARVLFKSSPFGSQSHGHKPQDSFQLNAYGEALLVACGYRDLHGSKFHYQWAHSTRAQNAVLVNGEGQIPHSVASTGRIVRKCLTCTG